MSKPIPPITLVSIKIADSASAWRACGFHVSRLLNGGLSPAVVDCARRDSERLRLPKENMDTGVIVLSDGITIILLGRQPNPEKGSYPVSSYTLAVPGLASTKSVLVHGAMHLHLIPESAVSSTPTYIEHPNGITCIDRVSLNSQSHAGFAASLGSLVHPAMGSARSIEDYPNGLKMGFWKARTPLSTAENAGGVLLEVIERKPKKAGKETRTTIWGFIMVARDVAKTHGIVEGLGRARKLKDAGERESLIEGLERGLT